MMSDFAIAWSPKMKQAPKSPTEMTEMSVEKHWIMADFEAHPYKELRIFKDHRTSSWDVTTFTSW